MLADQVFLAGMIFYGYHGVNPEERTLGQRFIVDLEVTADLTRAGQTDDLDDTVNYTRLFQIVRAAVEGTPRNLLEAVAADIAAQVLANEAVEEVTVRIRKPGVAIRGSILEASGIQITRSRT